MSKGNAGVATLSEVIGQNLRRLRLTAEMSQGDLADFGVAPGWTRDTVASVEVGRRPLSVEELFLLASFFMVAVGEFLGGGDPYLQVRYVGSGSQYSRRSDPSLPLSIFRQMLAESPKSESELREHLAFMRRERVFKNMSNHDPTSDIAERLGIPRARLNDRARRLWGQSVQDEYLTRFVERADEDAPRRSLANIRGHVVRSLTAELGASRRTGK